MVDRKARPSLAATTTVRVGDGVFAVPTALLRAGAKPSDGRLRLALAWPGLGPVDQAGAQARSASRLGDVVLVTVAQAEGPAPGDRLAGVYGRFLESAVAPGPEGLLARRFRAGSPFEGEEVLFTPPDGRAFTARCDQRPRSGDVLQPLCTAELRRGGYDIEVRFEPRLAERWERIGEVLVPMVAGMAR